MKTLRRYLASEILSSIGLVLVALTMLWLFYEFVQDIGTIKALTLPQLAILIVASIPGHLYELLPIAALIGTLFALAQLASNSEYGVIRTSGVSILQLAGLISALGLGIASLVFVIGEFVVPQAEQLVIRVRAFSGGPQMVARAFQSGYWFKDKNTFINVGSVISSNTVRNVRVFEYNEGTVLQRMLIAESGKYQSGRQWTLEKVTETEFGAEGIKTTTQPERVWLADLTPNTLSVLQVEPERLSLSGLWDYIRHLRENKQESRRFEGALWGKFFFPLATCVLMLLALPFAQIQQRSGGVASRIFIGILLGLVFIVFNRMFAYLTQLNQWPPFLGAMLPGLIFLVLAWLMLWRLERR